MSTIKCPKCGEVFTVDESGYAAIVNQVRDKEFHQELNERLAQLEATKNSEIREVEANLKAEAEKKASDLRIQLEKFKADVSSLKKERDDIESRVKTDYEAQLQTLKAELQNRDNEKKLAVADALNGKNQELAQKAQDILRLENTYKLELSKKEQEISALNSKITDAEKERQISEQQIRDSYTRELKDKDEQIDYYKDLKTKMSTKMLGETLEQHCEIEFNRLRHTAFPNAYFEKDNDIRSGSKGDYIFRDKTDDGLEFISIMFDMKNEMDTTATKHKNEDFFKELDKDRREKGCEYAILVSMLEADSEYYNTGIVDVSHKYPKMYVVRPQFFIQIISLLRNAAFKTVRYKQEIEEYKNRNIDISLFEDELNDFKTRFGKNYIRAKEHFDDAIKRIDKTIEDLQKIRKALSDSDHNLRLANDKAQDLTMKKLTKNSPSLAEQIKDKNSRLRR